MDVVEVHFSVCCWMKTVPPVDGGCVPHLSPSCHPLPQARPAPDSWSVETHLARHLRPRWSRSHDDSSSAWCWWRFLSALLGFLWRKASLLQSNGKQLLLFNIPEIFCRYGGYFESKPSYFVACIHMCIKMCESWERGWGLNNKWFLKCLRS